LPEVAAATARAYLWFGKTQQHPGVVCTKAMHVLTPLPAASPKACTTIYVRYTGAHQRSYFHTKPAIWHTKRHNNNSFCKSDSKVYALPKSNSSDAPSAPVKPINHHPPYSLKVKSFPKAYTEEAVKQFF
jgi:hypothetical protein